MTIVIAGGSGFIGTELTKALLDRGDVVIVIDKRGPSTTHKNLFFIPCDLETNTLPFNVLERTDALINLAGKSISGKWTEKTKNQIRDSRVLPTKHLVDSLEKTTNKPPIFISASDIGYYDETKIDIADEKTPKGNTFFSTVIEEWEKEAMKAEAFGSRVVIVRTAVVLGKKGFLQPLWQMARLHIVGKYFKKDFWMPWVHIKDIVRIYLFAIETNTLQGTVNAVSPVQTQYYDFLKAFKKETKAILLSKIPFVKIILGEFANETMIDNKVFPQRLTDKGFTFSFTNINEAIKSIKNDKK